MRLWASSRYTGDDDVGESNICTDRKRRSYAINSPNRCDLLIYIIFELHSNIAQIYFYGFYIRQRVTATEVFYLVQ